MIAAPAVFAFAPDQARADAAADAVLRQLLDAETAFGDEILAPDVAVARAVAIAQGAGKPVVLADTQGQSGRRRRVGHRRAARGADRRRCARRRGGAAL